MDYVQALCGVTALLVTWMIVAWELWQKHRVGRLIRTLRYELIFGVFGTLSVLIGFEVIIEWLLQTPTDAERWVMAGIAMVTVSSVFLVGTPQLEIREQGFWYRGTAVPWHEIVTYEWQPILGRVVLVVSLRTPHWASSTLTVRISVHDRELVDAQLKAHCPSHITVSPSHPETRQG